MRFPSIRRALIILAGIGALGLSAAAPALAADNTQATIFTETAFCGGAPNTSAPVAGFMNVHLNGTTVSLNIHLKDAVPGDRYALYAYEGFCTFNSFLGFVTPNSNGVVNLDASFTLLNAADTSVFVAGFPLTGTTIESVSATP